MGLSLKSFLAMESEEERIPVEEVIEMDDTETPTEDGETLDPEVSDDESKDTDATDDETKSEDDQTDDVDDTEVGGGEPLDDGEPVIEDEAGAENTEGEKDEGEPTESDEKEVEESEPTEEEKEEAEEALEQLKEIVSNAALAGGLSEGEAELVSMSLNMVGKKVSLSQERMVPSLEAFSEFSSRRLLATNVVLNNIEYALSQLRG